MLHFEYNSKIGELIFQKDNSASLKNGGQYKMKVENSGVENYVVCAYLNNKGDFLEIINY